MDQVELLEVAARLRRLLEAVEVGDVAGSSAERAYLAGAADVLERISRSAVSDTTV